MMTHDIIFALMAFAFASSISPGPNNLMLMTSGINFGFTRSLPHLFGVGFGFMVMIFLIGLGLARVFDNVPYSYSILKYVSAAYLLYMAWKIATTTSRKTHQKIQKPISFLQGVLFQWVNPKAWIMCVTAVTTYTATEESWINTLLIAAIFGAIMFPAISLWMFVGTKMQRLINSPRKLKIFNQAAALLLVLSLLPAFL